MHKYFYTLLICWGLGASYFALQHQDLKGFIIFFSGTDKKKISSDPNKVLPKLIKAIIEYYDFDSASDLNSKLDQISKNFSKQLPLEIIPIYKRELEYLQNKKGSRKFEISKIEWDKTNDIYFVSSTINQKIPKELDKTYKLKLTVKFEERKQESQAYLIKGLSEKIYKSKDGTLENNFVVVEKDISSFILLPCKPRFISQKDNKNIDSIKVSQEGKQAVFNLKKNLGSVVNFEAVCDKNKFNILLASNDSPKTIYQVLSASDGIQNVVKLSDEEKLYKDIERELGLKIKSVRK